MEYFDDYCVLGTCKPSGASVCQQCAAGHYQANTGMRKCNLCPKGYYCPVSRSYNNGCKVCIAVIWLQYFSIMFGYWLEHYHQLNYIYQIWMSYKCPWNECLFPLTWCDFTTLWAFQNLFLWQILPSLPWNVIADITSTSYNCLVLD